MNETIPDRLNRAFSLFDTGDLDAAEAMYTNLLSQQALTAEETAQCLMGFGYVLCARRAFEKAAEIYERLLFMAASEEDKHIAYHQLAMVKRESGAYPEALKLIGAERTILNTSFPYDALKRAVNAYEEGYLRFKTGDFSQAEEWLKKSLLLAAQTDDFVAQACAHRGLGELFYTRGQVMEAQSFFAMAKRLFLEAGDDRGAAGIEDIPIGRIS